MHRQLKRLLRNTYGVSDTAVVVVVDVRGFTEFCQKQESAAVAQYLKRFYLHLIDNYYPNSRFVKPTGDGLLIIRPYTPRNLSKVAVDSVRASLRLVEDFPTVCAEDPMVNFAVPDKVGVGICRGAVCALVSGKQKMTIDYSGRFLNLSARLTEMARPAGVVFDASFGLDLLPEDMRGLFTKESVYVRSVAEREPMDVYSTKEWTEILPAFKNPMCEPKWKTERRKFTLKQLRQLGPFRHVLPSPPEDPSSIKVRVTSPKVEKGGRRLPGYGTIDDITNLTSYAAVAGEHAVDIDLPAVVKMLAGRGVKSTWAVKIRIDYHEK